MKAYKSVLIIIYVLFVLGIGLGVASATEQWFSNPNTVYSQGVFTVPYGVDIDCVPDGSQCLSAVYVDDLLNDYIYLYSSSDDFATSQLRETITISYATRIGYMETNNERYSAMPMAVKYNPDDGLYYIVTATDVYSFDLTTLTNEYSTSVRGSTGRFIGLVNGNEPYLVVLHGVSSSKNLRIHYLFNGTQITDLGSHAVAGDHTNPYGWFIATEPPAGGTYKYYFRFNNGDTWTSTSGLPNTLIYGYSAENDYLRYLNETGQVVRVTTDDFSAYSNQLIEFQQEPTQANISGYHVKETDDSFIYTYLNWTENNTANTGYFFQQDFYQTFISGSYYDVQAEFYKTNLNISAQIECFNTTYSDSLSDFLTINHPCVNYTLTVFSSSDYRPVSFTKDTSVQDGCDYNLIYARFIKEYDYTITVFDDVTQLPLQNANVQFGSQSGTTDTNGEVSFTILPLTNITMSKTDYDVQCREEYVASASAVVSYPLTITKSGYTSYFEPATSPAEFVGDEIEYDDDIQINLRPVGGNVIVRLRDKNGIQIQNKDLSSVTQVITNGTVYIVDDVTGATYIGNSKSGVPINFFITSNQSTFNVTVNFTYLNYTLSEIVEVEQDETTIVYFRINESITEMQCESNNDCVDTYCSGNFLYKLSGCIGGECSYQTPELCSGGCDPEIGCYENKLTTTCETRYDCPSSCSSNFASLTGLCASDGYCVQIKDICDIPCLNDSTRGCNATTGICCESETCYEQGFSLYFFQLGYAYASGIIPQPVSVTVTDTAFTCGIENQGERFCIDGGNIPITVNEGLVGVQTALVYTPLNWEYDTTTTEYQFYDVAIRCGANCNASISYCENGCNPTTGFCYNIPIDKQGVVTRYGIDIYQPLPIIEDSINKTQFAEMGLGFLLLFTTPIFLVTIIGVLLGIISAYLTKEPVVGVSSMIILFTVFSLLQLYPIWIPLVIIIVAGLFFSKMFTGLWNKG